MRDKGPSTESEFDSFVRARSASLLRTAVLLTGNLHDGQDLLQNSLLRTYRRWQAASDNPVPYVRRVMINLSQDRRRNLLRRPTTVELGSDRDPSAPDTSTEIVDRDALLQALGHLPRRQRTVLVLRYWEDLSLAETADLMECSIGTVKSQSHKALASLRIALSDTWILAEKEGPTR